MTTEGHFHTNCEVESSTANALNEALQGTPYLIEALSHSLLIGEDGAENERITFTFSLDESQAPSADSETFGTVTGDSVSSVIAMFRVLTGAGPDNYDGTPTLGVGTYHHNDGSTTYIAFDEVYPAPVYGGSDDYAEPFILGNDAFGAPARDYGEAELQYQGSPAPASLYTDEYLSEDATSAMSIALDRHPSEFREVRGVDDSELIAQHAERIGVNPEDLVLIQRAVLVRREYLA